MTPIDINPYHITQHIMNENGGWEACSDIAPDGSRIIRADKIEALTDSVLFIIADLIATLIDAGSERDAVMESDPLRTAITDELTDWSK